MDNSAYLNRYIEKLEEARKTPGTLKQYKSDLQPFISWLDESIETDLLRIDAAHVTGYIEHLKKKKLSETTIKRHISVINRFLTFHQIDTAITSELAKTYKASPLRSQDFISEQEMTILLESMKQPINSAARDKLISRNLAIVLFVRYKGLRPSEIASINMDTVNLVHSTIEFKRDGQKVQYQLSGMHAQYIKDYLRTIDPIKKPKWRSNEPLFVSFDNRSHSFQYDYENEQPKRLSARGIQEMIKDEVRLAGLRKLSAKHLRNSCILEHLKAGQPEKELQQTFHLTHPFSLHRYKQYRESTLSQDDGIKK
ncbi:hypothetical protein CHH61_03470 [Shouchella clausii]|uniref:Integrase n=1 Tax=Shouchella clausii TaxID=79880 RepID=A0A268S6T5_SHOCL|nr:site-specific integrase [Shouchella clausii]PAF27391.1 hypothetical protein CHH61_03470 [Shouchella clausii]